jgi:hypothetical protein
MVQGALIQRHEPRVVVTVDRSECDRIWLAETKWDELRIDVAFHSSERQDIEHALTLLHHVDKFVALSEHNSLSTDHEMSGGNVCTNVFA